ncbi:MAG TPA: hypothetical protein VI968_01895 [archaeon]|nr:hypothetical protein [archaeon]
MRYVIQSGRYGIPYADEPAGIGERKIDEMPQELRPLAQQALDKYSIEAHVATESRAYRFRVGNCGVVINVQGTRGRNANRSALCC